MCEKYVQDGKVAVLVAPGYGAGWSTWNQPALAYDKRVVEYYLERKDDKDLCKKISRLNTDENKKASKYFESLGYKDVYFGGFKDLVIEWMPEGVYYKIDEYDGYESIITIDSVDWSIA